jgi:hypothetical protein
MSAQQVDELVKTIISAGTPNAAELEKQLGATLKPTQANPFWSFYVFELASGPLQGGEFRISAAGDRALLSLTPRANAPLTEADFDLRQWGSATNVDINPQIPPEGTDGYTYAVNGTRLSFQFTHVTRRLRTVTVEWGRQT